MGAFGKRERSGKMKDHNRKASVSRILRLLEHMLVLPPAGGTFFIRIHAVAGNTAIGVLHKLLQLVFKAAV